MKISKSAVIRTLALCWLVATAAYGYGLVSYKYNIWPYSAIAEVWRFAKGHEDESTTLTEKIVNDLGLLPTRLLFPSAKLAYPVAAYRRLEGLPLDKDRETPLVYLAPDAPRGFRVLYGAFSFADKLHGVVLLDPDGKVRRFWKVSQEGTPWRHQPDTNLHPHGFDIARDGSILVAFSGGHTLTRYNYCGGMEWRLEGEFHHSIELGDDGTFWTWRKGPANATVPRNNKMDGFWDKKNVQIKREGVREEWAYQISLSDGATKRRFTIQDIIDANPGIDILGVRQEDLLQGSRWETNPFHPNDIDPLPSALAGLYPLFSAGDLLISMRSSNLVFVIDPTSLKVKWWRQGLVRRQHDPDWNHRGTITIFNNSMHRPPSSIVEIDPGTMQSRTLVGGAKYDFYVWETGNHDVSPQDHVMIAAPLQGRAFEVAPDGRVTFDFHNIYSEKAGSLYISEALFLPLDYFRDLPRCGG